MMVDVNIEKDGKGILPISYMLKLTDTICIKSDLSNVMMKYHIDIG